MDLIVPDPRKSLREGAIAPWNTPAYAHELEELITLAPNYQIPLDVPFKSLTEDHLKLIREGVPERNFGGLRGFFSWLEKHKYKMHLRVFLSRWRSYRTCPSCHGARLRPEALATQIAGRNMVELCELKIRDAVKFFRELKLPKWQEALAAACWSKCKPGLVFWKPSGWDISRSTVRCARLVAAKRKEYL